MADSSINPLMFREYDIRGVAGQDLTVEVVREIGVIFANALQDEVGGRRVAVSRDGRLSSPWLSAALIEGLVAGGAHVIDIGMGPTPALYFATHHLTTDAGIMITGSHNPPEYNGLKMVRQHRAVYGADIQRLGQRLLAGPGERRGGGSVELSTGLHDAYLARLLEGFRARPDRPLRVVVDCGNGAAGNVAAQLFQRLPGVQADVLFAEVDGTFPNHHPDPTVERNLVDLRRQMTTVGADLGIAFDGDGDRLGVLDEQGQIIWGDCLMVLFARAVLREHPGACVIGDVKCSQRLFDAIRTAGGVPVMWKTGHSLIKAKMRDSGALLAGEMSGHLFFADRYFGYDDALYAALRLIEVAAGHEGPLSSLLADLPEVFATPEMRIHCPDDRKFGVMERIAAEQKRAGRELSDIDGVRVRTEDGWWLLRVSNTQPAMVARVEASSPAGLQRLTDALQAILAAEGVDLHAGAAHG